MSNRRRATRRRNREREWSQRQRKEPGRHRPDCHCNTCISSENSTPCWNCGQSRHPPPPRWNGPPPPGHRMPPGPGGPPRPPRDRRRPTRHGPPVHVVIEELPQEVRMSEEDLRTWSLAYSLSVDVYVAAQRYLMKDFKECIAAYVINQFEIAGLDAANASVLTSCRTLLAGLTDTDPLLKKVFARVGFLQARMWKFMPDFTTEFFAENPELAMLIMKEMAERREEDLKGDLPAMERPVVPQPPPGFQPHRRQYHHGLVDD
jgi:hypothetical protein